jgi:pimeloyl-ACP methyl ester carboxylesterase
MYQVLRPPQSQTLRIRNLNYHVQVWGTPSPDKIPLVMVHGWMDVAASYQFVVDALSHAHYVIAPDWRGYGQSSHGGVDSFWFADYLADLDFLLDHYSPGMPVNLVGHSMGGNVVMMYAGIRPERIRRLINLEGFGLPASKPSHAPKRYAKWMDELKLLHRGEMDLKPYPNVAGVARRLMKTNPRLTADKAHWLAQHWASEDAQGQWNVQGQAAHKVSSAHLYRLDETLEIFKGISAPVLSVEASDDSLALWWKDSYTLDQFHERLRVVPNFQIARVEDAGHMLHHDQPAAVAALIEQFIA